MITHYNIGRCHNLFSSHSDIGDRAKSSNKWHNQIVRKGIRELNKRGFTMCYNDEQKQDIITEYQGELKVTYLEDEIMLEVV